MIPPVFQPFPKISRLNRDIVISEKIDGTNSAIQIVPCYSNDLPESPWIARVNIEGTLYRVAAQSRKRLITPQSDNFGFARWVHENARALAVLLGEGTHFGEWWGSGIQRGYGLENGDKRFSLFNRGRWNHENTEGVEGLSVVPVMYEGPMDTNAISTMLEYLSEQGSMAAPGFMKPEGIVIYHTAARGMFKVTLENDERAKGSNE